MKYKDVERGQVVKVGNAWFQKTDDADIGNCVKLVNGDHGYIHPDTDVDPHGFVTVVRTTTDRLVFGP